MSDKKDSQIEKTRRLQVLGGARVRLFMALSSTQYAYGVMNLSQDDGDRQKYQNIQVALVDMIGSIEKKQDEIITDLHSGK